MVPAVSQTKGNELQLGFSMIRYDRTRFGGASALPPREVCTEPPTSPAPVLAAFKFKNMITFLASVHFQLQQDGSLKKVYDILDGANTPKHSEKPKTVSVPCPPPPPAFLLLLLLFPIGGGLIFLVYIPEPRAGGCGHQAPV